MTVYFNKYKKAWLYDFQKDGNRYQGYCYDKAGRTVLTKTEAKDCETSIKAQLAKEIKKRPAIYSPNAYSLGDACLEYYKSVGEGKRNAVGIKKYIKSLLDFFGAEKPILSISNQELQDFIDHMQKIPHKTKYDGKELYRSNSTVNKYLSCLRAIINRAYYMRKIEGNIRIKLLDETEILPRPVPAEDIKKIIEAAPPHLKHIITIAYNTGMRLSEILTLRKDQLYLNDGFIILDDMTKAGKGRVVFMNETCKSSIDYFLKLGNNCEQVITYDGKAIRSIKRSWHTAQKNAGIVKKYRFHDLRASFCSFAASQEGASMLAIKELAGHKSPETTLRYMKSFDGQLKGIVNAIKI